MISILSSRLSSTNQSYLPNFILPRGGTGIGFIGAPQFGHISLFCVSSSLHLGQIIIQFPLFYFLMTVKFPLENDKQRIILHIMVILVSIHIVLYHHRKSEHHLGTKALKINAVLSVLTCWKVSIFKFFHGLRHFDSTNSNTIFYIFLAQAGQLSFPKHTSKTSENSYLKESYSWYNLLLWQTTFSCSSPPFQLFFANNQWNMYHTLWKYDMTDLSW